MAIEICGEMRRAHCTGNYSSALRPTPDPIILSTSNKTRNKVLKYAGAISGCSARDSCSRALHPGEGPAYYLITNEIRYF